jgi:hypothetical protein
VTLIRDKHPRLHDMLHKAGAREIDFEASLPLALRDKYAPANGDRDLAFLFSRRTTLEHTIRAYVETLPGVRFVTSAIVRALLLDKAAPIPTVNGVRVEQDGGAAEDLTAAAPAVSTIGCRTTASRSTKRRAPPASSTSPAITACATAKTNRHGI